MTVQWEFTALLLTLFMLGLGRELEFLQFFELLRYLGQKIIYQFHPAKFDFEAL